MLDVRRMQVLRAVVTSGSITAAATNLGYTPSAVSQQVAALEKQAGTPLLERVGRGVRPTEAGRLLSEHAAVISRQVTEAETALADLRARISGLLSIRYFATAGATLVAPALARFRQEHPGIRIDLRMTDPRDPLTEVTEGRADLAVVVRARGRTHEGVHLVPLLDDPYRAVLPAGHPLAVKRVLDLTDLAEEHWIRGDGPGPCLDPVIEGCAAAGFSPNFVVESEDHTTTQGFVAAGLGIGLVPAMGLTHRHPGVVVRKVRGPEPVRAIHAAVRDASSTRPALHGLLAALRDVSAARSERGGERGPVAHRSG